MDSQCVIASIFWKTFRKFSVGYLMYEFGRWRKKVKSAENFKQLIFRLQISLKHEFGSEVADFDYEGVHGIVQLVCLKVIQFSTTGDIEDMYCQYEIETVVGSLQTEGSIWIFQFKNNKTIRSVRLNSEGRSIYVALPVKPITFSNIRNTYDICFAMLCLLAQLTPRKKMQPVRYLF